MSWLTAGLRHVFGNKVDLSSTAPAPNLDKSALEGSGKRRSKRRSAAYYSPQVLTPKLKGSRKSNVAKETTEKVITPKTHPGFKSCQEYVKEMKEVKVVPRKGCLKKPNGLDKSMRTDVEVEQENVADAEGNEKRVGRMITQTQMYFSPMAERIPEPIKVAANDNAEDQKKKNIDASKATGRVGRKGVLNDRPVELLERKSRKAGVKAPCYTTDTYDERIKYSIKKLNRPRPQEGKPALNKTMPAFLDETRGPKDLNVTLVEKKKRTARKMTAAALNKTMPVFADNDELNQTQAPKRGRGRVAGAAAKLNKTVMHVEEEVQKAPVTKKGGAREGKLNKTLPIGLNKPDLNQTVTQPKGRGRGAPSKANKTFVDLEKDEELNQTQAPKRGRGRVAGAAAKLNKTVMHVEEEVQKAPVTKKGGAREGKLNKTLPIGLNKPDLNQTVTQPKGRGRGAASKANKTFVDLEKDEAPQKDPANAAPTLLFPKEETATKPPRKSTARGRLNKTVCVEPKEKVAPKRGRGENANKTLVELRKDEDEVVPRKVARKADLNKTLSAQIKTTSATEKDKVKENRRVIRDANGVEIDLDDFFPKIDMKMIAPLDESMAVKNVKTAKKAATKRALPEPKKDQKEDAAISGVTATGRPKRKCAVGHY